MIPDDWSPLWISVKTSAAATLLAFVTGIAAAGAMSRYRSRWRPLWDGLLTLPLVLPPTVIGFFLLLIFGRRSLIGRVLEQIGITIAFSWPATVIAATVVAFPLMYRATLGAFEQVNPNLLDAARTLGAGELRVFGRVLVPLAWPGIMAGTVLAFARALGEFGATLMLAGNIPGRTQTMPIAIFFAAEAGNMNRALAWVLLIVALSLAIIAGLNYWGSSGRVRGFARQAELDAVPLPPVHIGESRAHSRTAVLEFDIEKVLGTFRLSIASTLRAGTAGLLGASGSGKSLALRCIAGLELPERGRVAVNGRVLFDAERGIRVAPAQRRVGFVFQDYALFPHLTVAQNIAFGLERWSDAERRQRVARWAEVVQLTPWLERFPHQLSGGQRQRVALARALAVEPEVLLLDEPFSALDPHLRRQLEDELHEILSRFDGVTVFVTHNRDEAFRFCEQLLVLSDGRVVSSGATRELFDNPGTLAAARLTGCKNLAPARAVGEDAVRVENWGCTIRVLRTVDADTEYAGIRAHYIQLTRDRGGENTFPCWLMERIDSPFEVTLYLRLHAPPQDGDCAHLEAEMPRDRWKELAEWPQPWYALIPAERILLLRA